MSVALFDLDRTLIDINSGLQWARHERRQKNISSRNFARAAFWTGMYHLSLINMETAMEQALLHYRGVPGQELELRTRAWFYAEVEQRIRPKALECIAWHKAKGHRCAIVTNASCFEAKVAAEVWGLDAYFGNDFAEDQDGRLTGRLASEMCYGEGKVNRVRAWFEKENFEFDAAYFYSDSLSDVPLLEAVGHAKVVSPDPRLRRWARKRGWEILNW